LLLNFKPPNWYVRKIGMAKPPPFEPLPWQRIEVGLRDGEIGIIDEFLRQFLRRTTSRLRSRHPRSDSAVIEEAVQDALLHHISHYRDF
jgi:hypothetical protein